MVGLGEHNGEVGYGEGGGETETETLEDAAEEGHQIELPRSVEKQKDREDQTSQGL